MVKTERGSNDKVASFYRLMRLMIASALFLMTAILWFSNNYFTTRFTESARIDAAVRSTLYSGNIAAALEKQQVVPLILSKDQTLDHGTSVQRFSQRLPAI